MKRFLTLLLFLPAFAGAQTRFFPGKSVFQGQIVIDSLKGATGLATDATGKIIAGTGGVTPIAFQDSLNALNARLATKAALADTANALRTLVFSANDFVSVAAFGAIPNDPSKGAVNDAAFAAALATGKRVYVPTGTWTLASDLTLTGSQMIFGDGAGSVIAANLYVSGNATATNCAATYLNVSGNATATNCAATYLNVYGNATATNCTATNLNVYGNATATNCTATNFLNVYGNATATNCTATNFLYVSGNATATNCTAVTNLDVRGNARLFGGSVSGNTRVSNTTNARLIGVRFSSADVYLQNNTGLQRIGCIDNVAPNFTGPQGGTGWANIGGANYTAGTGIEISGNSISVAAAKVTAWDGAVTAAAAAQSTANAAIPSTQKGVANGVATLGADGILTPSQRFPTQNLTAGSNIEISGNAIAVAGAKATAWDGAVTKSNANETNLATLTQDFNFATKNITEFTASSIWNTSGVIAANASFKRTAKYRTQAGVQFKVPAGQTGVVAQAVFWKSDGTLLSTVQNQSGVITAPANAYYVAFSVPNAATEIKVSGGFWSLQQQGNNNLLLEYTHTGQKEVNITSIDYATNTFTSPAHGLVNTVSDVQILFLFPKDPAARLYDIMPFDMINNWAKYRGGFCVVNATTNTFQLALTPGGAPITLRNVGQTGAQISAQVLSNSLVFKDLPATGRIRVEIAGNMGAIYYPGLNNNAIPEYYVTQTATPSDGTLLTTSNGAFTFATGATSHPSILFVAAQLNIVFSLTAEGRIKREITLSGQQSSTVAHNALAKKEQWAVRTATPALDDLTTLSLYYCYFANGTTIRIYKY